MQLTMRIALADITIGDHTVTEGSSIMALLGAANRDPDCYVDPDRLDITRTGTRVLSFGGAPHLCLGAALARIEGQIALRELLTRYRRIELATDEPAWKPGLVVRGLDALLVHLTPA